MSVNNLNLFIFRARKIHQCNRIQGSEFCNISIDSMSTVKSNPFANRQYDSTYLLGEKRGTLSIELLFLKVSKKIDISF